jgi:spore maturation protein CgeB
MSDTSKLSKLSARMKADWDRRISHDYRFWMSDSYKDDTAMWAAGERDVQALLNSPIPAKRQGAFLEVGCGVGRLLRAASKRFESVVGLDVSESAINKAHELLKDLSNVELKLADGITIPYPDGTFDLVSSFAALASMPVEVIASYLREMRRVVKNSGHILLQLYFGIEQVVSADDTLHLRCFNEDKFREAAKIAGFKVLEVRELNLPFQVSFKEAGLTAVVVDLVPESQPESTAEISKALGADQKADERADVNLEHWMALNYANELVERGDFEAAKRTLEYAVSFTKAATIDTRDLLARVTAKIESFSKGENSRAAELWQENLSSLRANFPKVADLVELYAGPLAQQGSTEDGPVTYDGNQVLDHASKPRSAAEAWAKRVLSEVRVGSAKRLAVFGFGTGYHIEALQRLTDRKIGVFEPSVSTLVTALKSRPLAKCIERLVGLAVQDQALEFLDSDTEVVARPQTQVGHGEKLAAVKSACYSKRGASTLHPSIAVLGPLHGGTLPIAGYTSRALKELKQRTRDLDVSGFNSGYTLLDKFLTNQTRQAIIQSTYVEMVSQVLLESLDERPVDVLICMAQAPISGRVLGELKKRGVITVLWFVEDFLRFTYWREMAKYYDFVFTIQKGQCIDAIRAAGAQNVQYLPCAADPLVHRPVEITAEERAKWGSPISFVGAGYHNRQQSFALLADMPFKIWGSEWPHCRPFDKMLQEQGRRISPEEYVKIFNATDININLHSSTEKDGVDPTGDFVNPRTFELASCGAFQLVDERSLLSELFTPGDELITFSNIPQLKQQIHHYLNAPEERRAITAKAKARVLREHTYEQRIRQMLAAVYSVEFEKLNSRELQSPWRKMIERSSKFPELKARCEDAFSRGEDATLDALLTDILAGKGKLTETEQKLLFLYHIRKQIIYMAKEEQGK